MKKSLYGLFLVLLSASAAWPGSMTCTLTKSDWAALSKSDSKMTPDALKNLSPGEAAALCRTRVFIRLIHKKKSRIDTNEIVAYNPKFLSKEECAQVKKACLDASPDSSKAPAAEKCQADSADSVCSAFSPNASSAKPQASKLFQ